MLRQVALDTETTGKTDDGTPGEHRIIEVGCVEIVDRRITGRQLQLYVNPERPIDPEAIAVHGITDEFVADKPRFAQVAPELIDFIRGSELLIHNAKFDTSFLDKEWMLMQMDERTADLCTIVDTLALARRYNPGNQVNLDNLCHLYEIDNSRRKIHGALLDAQLLAEVYLAMTGGQSSLEFNDQNQRSMRTRHWQRPAGAKLPLMQVETASRALHCACMLEMAQKQKSPAPNGFKHLSTWGEEFDLECLEQGENESKKDFALRLKQQREDKLKQLLSADELMQYQGALKARAAAQAAWEDRVKKGIIKQ